MTPEILFSLCNPLAMAGWILLIFAPRKPWASRTAGLIIPLLLAVIYVSLLALHWGETSGGFSGAASTRT